MIKKQNPKPLTKTELFTVINLKNQGLDSVEIETLTGLNWYEIQNACNNASKLMKGRRSIK
jgi:hypothetical protein